MDLGLKGRVAVVTGAAAGIGAAIARTLVDEGCCVWIADVDGVQAARTASALSIGSSVHAVTFDVTSNPEVEAAIETIVEAEGRLDILICNAGILRSGPFLESTPSDWEAVVAVNLSGVMNCIRAAVKPMIRRGSGRIINVASISAMRGGGSIGNILYGTSKAGVVALTLGLAREFGPHNITVNAVAPAVAETPMTRATLTEEVTERILSRIPLGRLAIPSDIADAVAFLASERAGFITGAIVPIDGGILTT
jgi:NAD(P)-dependent dehydrogenase (short-subunit alcohol dehydrogenase family)